MELIVEWDDEQWVLKIDERIPNICLLLEIDGQVKEVIPSLMFLIDLLENGSLIVLVRDVLNHKSSSHIFSILNLFNVKLHY